MLNILMLLSLRMTNVAIAGKFIYNSKGILILITLNQISILSWNKAEW